MVENEKSPLSEAIQTQNKGNNFQDFIVQIGDKFAEALPVVAQGGRIIVSRGNIAAVIGKAKSFKTFLVSAICAAFLEDETLSLSGAGGRCLVVDSEQSRAHVNLVQSRIYQLCGWEQDKPENRLTMLALRELDAKTRLMITIEAAKSLKPDLIILDGIRDFCLDFNNLQESAELVGRLMAVSSKQECGIIAVLHQNKGDNNARGHLGSELCNKSETVLQVVNEGGIATVSPLMSRNLEISPFSFKINSSGLPEACCIPKIEKRTRELEDLVSRAMFGSSWWSQKDLEGQISRISGKSLKTAQRKLKEALKTGVVKFNQVGKIILTRSLEPLPDDDLPI